jgi:DNA-binding NarL/FixJ family response regulator
MVLKKHPELILLDDILKPSDTALDSLPMIRHTGYKGPIVIVSANVDRFRRAELLAKGADDTINKDELDSGAIAKTLLRLAEADKFVPPS